LHQNKDYELNGRKPRIRETSKRFDHNEQRATIRATTSALAPSVTVVMANFNGENWIGEAIKSLQRQSVTDWELIVVDDASTDASAEIVRAAAANDPRIVLLTSSTNAGPGVARNRALACARGRWITVLDSDDLFADGRTDRLAPECFALPGAPCARRYGLARCVVHCLAPSLRWHNLRTALTRVQDGMR
jgi:glycosyltransferase involved in cell wall biosynthesis